MIEILKTNSIAQDKLNGSNSEDNQTKSDLLDEHILFLNSSGSLVSNNSPPEIASKKQRLLHYFFQSLVVIFGLITSILPFYQNITLIFYTPYQHLSLQRFPEWLFLATVLIIHLVQVFALFVLCYHYLYLKKESTYFSQSLLGFYFTHSLTIFLWGGLFLTDYGTAIKISDSLFHYCLKQFVLEGIDGFCCLGFIILSCQWNKLKERYKIGEPIFTFEINAGTMSLNFSLSTKKEKIKLIEKGFSKKIDCSSCPICYGEFIEGTCRVIELKCSSKHVYHKNCLLSWLKTKLECPLCREKVK